jgi:hypothetical protein
VKATGNALSAMLARFAPTASNASPKAPETAGDLTTAGTSSMPGIDPASSASSIEAQNAELRQGVRSIATALGAVATLIVGTVGFTRADDIFPLRDAPGWLGVVTALFAGLALVCTAALIARLYVVQQQILIGSRLQGFGRWEPFDRRAVEKLAADAVRGLGETSLYAMDLRANRLVRIAHRLDPLASDARDAKPPEHPTHEQRLAHLARVEALRLQDVVRLELVKLGSNLLRRRARRAFGGPTSYLLLGGAIFGVAWAFGVGDWAKGRRSLHPPTTTTTVITRTVTTSSGSTTVTKTITGG